MCKVFVGSFRGGKRGGSRTAHLKAPAAQAAAEAAPAAAPKPSPWRTTRSRQPASRQAPSATSSRQDRGHLSVAPAIGPNEAEPIEDEEDEEGVDPEAEEVHTEGNEMEQDDEDEEVSDMEAEEEDELMAGAMHAEGSGELVFEVDVVDALAGIPTSQPDRWDLIETDRTCKHTPAAPPLCPLPPLSLPPTRNPSLPPCASHIGMPISRFERLRVNQSRWNKVTPAHNPQPPSPSNPH